jgi:cell division protein ZapA (FtsZ GTPase activity inhibitor)
LARLVTFEVLGQEYPLYTEASDEDVQEILNMVKSKIEEAVGGVTNVLPSSKAAILTSLNVASEYVKLKKKFAGQQEIIDEQLARLTEKIESSL